MIGKYVKKIFFIWVIFLLLGLGLEVGPSEKITEGKSIRRPFTLDDALALETLNFSPKIGITRDGDFIAYAVIDGYHQRSKSTTPYRYVPQGSYVFVKSLKDGQLIQVTRGEKYSWTPSWAPNGRKLAFYVWHNKQICIGIWDRESEEIEFFELKNLKGKGSLDWGPKSDKLFYFPTSYIMKESVAPYEKSEKIIIRSSWERDSYENRFTGMWQRQLWVLDLKSKEVSPIVPEDISFYSYALSPNGKKMAVSELIRRKVMAHLVPSYVKLDIYPVKGGQPKTLFFDKVMTTSYSWSPNSESIAYVDDGKLWIYDLGKDEVKQLSKDKLKISGLPLWRSNGKQILCRVGNNPNLFDTKTGRYNSLKVMITYARQQYIWDKSGRYVYIKVTDTKTGKQGIFRFDRKKDETQEMMMGDWMIKHVRLVKERLFFTLQSATTPENIWMLDVNSGEKKKLTDVNKQAEKFSFGKSELVKWTGLAGDPLKGVLLYPADYKKGKKYPVIFWVYESFSHQLHSFFSRIFYYLQIFTNQGYAVFKPDVKFRIGETARSFKESIVPAMDRLIETGIANRNFGLLGHSFGGFATNSLITQTSRFKAAISSAGQSDWISRQGQPGIFWSRGDELGQARLGADLKDIPDVFVKNSPVFYLQNVKTPLMIVHGTRDYCVHFNQAEEMYYGLRNLNKTAILVAYPGEGHLGNGTQEWVIRDFWKRALSWYAKYLK